MTCLFLKLSLTNVYEDFLPGSHQYLLTAATVFWALGFIIANGVRLPNHIFCTSLISAHRLSYLWYARLPGVLSPNTPVVYPLLFVPDHKIWDGAITVSRPVHWFYSFGLCVSRCRFWRARDTLLGKARMRRPLELCMSSRGIMGRRLIWLWSSSWLPEVRIWRPTRGWFRERECYGLFRLGLVI